MSLSENGKCFHWIESCKSIQIARHDMVRDMLAELLAKVRLFPRMEVTVDAQQQKRMDVVVSGFGDDRERWYDVSFVSMQGGSGAEIGRDVRGQVKSPLVFMEGKFKARYAVKKVTYQAEAAAAGARLEPFFLGTMGAMTNTTWEALVRIQRRLLALKMMDQREAKARTFGCVWRRVHQYQAGKALMMLRKKGVQVTAFREDDMVRARYRAR
jgi:hypothetical protein